MSEMALLTEPTAVLDRARPMPITDDLVVGVGSSSDGVIAEGLAAQYDDRRLLRHAIGLTCVALIVFAVACCGWNLVIQRLGARPAVPEPFQTKLEACAAAPVPYDTVVIGSSRLLHGVDPHTFDVEMARLGRPTHTFNLGFDALDFPETLFLADQVLSDPRMHLRTLVIEPSLRARLAPGLEHSQRKLTLHDAEGSRQTTEFILRGNHDTKRKVYWTYSHAQVSAIRLANVGALTNRYVRPQEPPPDLAEMLGPAGDGYAGLPARIEGAREVTAAGIEQLVADQASREKAGRARRLNDYEVSVLADLDQKAAARGVRLVLLMPPTADADIYEEFAAVADAKRQGRIHATTFSFADPAAYPDLYAPAGFADPDHIIATSSELFTAKAAAALASEIGAANAPSAATREGNH